MAVVVPDDGILAVTFGGEWSVTVRPEDDPGFPVGGGIEPHDRIPVGDHEPTASGTEDWGGIAYPLLFTQGAWVSRTFTDPLGYLVVRRDCDYSVYVNGTFVVSGTTPGSSEPGTLEEVLHVLPRDTVPGGLAGLQVYAERKVRGGLDGWYLDMAVYTIDVDPEPKPVTRLYPRDSLGLAAAPRLYPPPRGGRLVGGHL